MKLGVLLYPHTNKRYYESMKLLAENELAVLLHDPTIKDKITFETIGGLELLCFQANESDTSLMLRLYRHSALLALFEVIGDTLKPLMADKSDYFPRDIAYILKYKGKTNEMFTEMLLNLGIFSSDFSEQFQEPLYVMDAMCGKATSMFIALKNGYHSAGIESNKNYYSEVENFIKRYFQFNRVKHHIDRTSYNVDGRKRALKFILETADTSDHYKTGDTRTLEYVLGDTMFSTTYFGKKKFHTIVADLPYGVQHQPANEPPKKGKGKAPKAPVPIHILDTIDDSINGWLSTLKVGGTLVLAFNSNSLNKNELLSLLLSRSLEIEHSHLDFSHWVEQSITRDIIIAKKI